jgi:hypothetical protein
LPWAREHSSAILQTMNRRVRGFAFLTNGTRQNQRKTVLEAFLNQMAHRYFRTKAKIASPLRKELS